MQPLIPLFKVFMDPTASAAVQRVLESGYVAEGPEVEAFEKELQQALGCARQPIATNSCTAALDLALHLAGVGSGDEVISTPMTCTATNSVIINRGAKIVWADVHPITGLIDPADVGKCITRHTKAIMAVDWAGQPCDYAALKKFGYPVIEDAAHALDARIPRVAPCPAWSHTDRAWLGVAQPVVDAGGDYVCLSFQAIKHLTCGDGGALFVPVGQVERAQRLRWFGLDRKSPADFRAWQTIRESGYKYHMNDVAAAIGRANLLTLEDRSDRHFHNASDLYWGIYGDNEWGSWGAPEPPHGNGAHWFYNIHVHNRDLFIKHMADCGIQVSQVHARNDRHRIFPDAPDADFPGLAAFSATQVALPCGWWLDDEDIERIVGAVHAWLK